MKNSLPNTIRSRFLLGILLLLAPLFLPTEISAQEKEIQWLSFEQLEDSLNVKPKKVFITFYADWCTYCKKMDHAAFKDSKVISKLHAEYYAVKMNAETTDSIQFDGKLFTNKQLGKTRNPTHEIPLLLASRENRPFSLPAMVLLDEKFEISDRYFEYLSPKQLHNILKQ
ncbi:thioredoxin family protein [Allomuricauda sp. SCSIO 65647]|uniref:thioredoxin family protein n=1 Tax=Allomuricauda sp. SCSIO 65647 TaxID=2908843 RepID=UPI001F2766A2|nr:thioredoxin fold domain-containing protein [Muricauda sp. SCSIO 65647]UJH68841.1 thioredoxin fold domain-containing protein [Muricauda sp. SCSIO 65647]